MGVGTLPGMDWKCPECGNSVIERRLRGPHVSACRRRAGARYEYDDEKDPQHKHPLVRRRCERCGKEALMRAERGRFCSVSCAQQGENNSRWAGSDGGYVAAHQRVYRALGPATSRRCMCGERARHWANLTGDYLDTYDYTAMCARCHHRYDRARRSMEES